MSQPIYLIASRHRAVSAALRISVGMFLRQAGLDHQLRTIAFHRSAEFFAVLNELSPSDLRNSVVLLDLTSETGDPWDVNDLRSERGLAVQILLSYPEVYCIFLGSGVPNALRLGHGDIDNHLLNIERLAGIVAMVHRHEEGFRTIFDATGLRSAVKSLLCEVEGAEYGLLYRPFSTSRLRHAAAVADEELTFAFLGGYAAFKAGFRAWLLSSKAEFRRVLPVRDEDRQTGPKRFDVILSDWDLAYPDLGANERGWDLVLNTERPSEEPLYLVTSFRDHISDEDAKRLWPHGSKDLGCRQKPNDGFYSFLTADGADSIAELSAGFANAQKEVDAFLASISMAEIRASRTDGKDSPGGHGAPFSRLVIAERLLTRARAMLAQLGDVQTAVHAAVLACEAKEILGGLSRTTFYDAVAAQHEAEVLAEITFLGSSAQVHVRERLRDFEKEVAFASRIVHGPNSSELPAETVARLNCLSRTTNNLRSHLGRYDQVPAAEECLHSYARHQRHLRSLEVSGILLAIDSFQALLLRISNFIGRFPRDETHSAIDQMAARTAAFRLRVAGRMRKSSSRVGGWLWTRGSWYLDWVTRSGTSISRLLLSNLGWILVFSLAYFWLIVPSPAQWPRRVMEFGDALKHSFFTFVAVAPGPPAADDWTRQELHRLPALPYYVILALEVSFAYLHLGLLLSMLYRRLTRHAP